jgi:hypothetical protein
MPLLLSTFDVALMLGCTLREVWALVERQELSPIELPYGFRFVAADVSSYQHRGVS